MAKDVAAANKTLGAKKLDTVKLMSHEEWDKKQPGSGTSAAGPISFRGLRRFF